MYLWKLLNNNSLSLSLPLSLSLAPSLLLFRAVQRLEYPGRALNRVYLSY